MPVVETARGPVTTEQLGVTLMHEHVFIISTEFALNYATEAEWDEEVRVEDAITKLGALKARGVDTIVDPTIVGLGRYIPRIQRIAGQVDLNIIVATGVYAFSEVPHFFHYRGPGRLFDVPEMMTELFLKDIREGIGGTSVKAAFLKVVTEEHGLTPDVERIMRATAWAHRETGVPITTHSNAPHYTGRLQQKLFAEEGVDLSRVVIGHSGDSTDLSYLRELMDNGSIIGMDRFGLDVLLPFADRVATVVALCKEGYSDRMVLSHDASCHIDFFTTEQRESVTPNWHFTHVHDDVLPALRERGVTEDQIDQMLVANPRRYFENVGSY